MDKAEKERLIAGTLEWCNAERAKQGKEPLTELPKGRVRDPLSCPCGTATGLWVGRHTFCSTDEKRYRDKPEYDLPIVVSLFTQEFDDGTFPELIDTSGTD